MNHPLSAAYYADESIHRDVRVIHREALAHETYLVRLECDDIAQKILPGQFIMVRQPDRAEPLLGRAFAVYDVVRDQNGNLNAIDIVFHIVGKMTTLLSKVEPGAILNIWGPLGNGFIPEPTEHLILVAGGIGQTPFLALAKEYLQKHDFGRSVSLADRVTLCYGARSKNLLAGTDHFEEIGVDVRIATDDGSAGKQGFVTDLLQDLFSECLKQSSRVVCCGPEKMMEAVSRLCNVNGVRCQVSLETPMACGIGICFSCVTKVVQPDGTWDFKRTCVDGPVFDATKLIW